MPRWALFGLVALIVTLAAYALVTSLVFCGDCIAPMSGQAEALWNERSLVAPIESYRTAG